MFRNEVRDIKVFQLISFFLGVLTIALGLYATEFRLTQFVTSYLSTNKVLSEHTISLLHRFRIMILLSGAVLVLLSIIAGYVAVLKDYIIKKIESGHLVEKTISSIGRFLDLIYTIGTNEKFLFCLLVLIFIIFLPFGVFLSPWGGFHSEGINLQLPKNLARHGIYATLTTRGFDEFTYRVSAGPGILIPIAIVFKIFGISNYHSRILYAVFIVLTAIVFYYVARNLYGRKVSLLALLLFVFQNGAFSGIMGADAYTPALFYFLVGAVFWFKSIETKWNIYLIMSGLFWGLSFQTQWLFLFAIFAVIVTCIILSLSKKGLGSKYYLIPSCMVFLVTMAWFIFRVFNVGLRQELIHLEEFWREHGHRAFGASTEQGVVSSILAFARPIVSLSQIDLWGELQLFLIIPAIVYAVIRIGRSKLADYKSLFFISFTLIWFTWWLLFNYDLPETHLSIVIIMSQLFIAKLLYDIWEYSSESKESFLDLLKNKEIQGTTISYILKIIIICIVLGNTVLPFSRDIGNLYNYNLTLTKPEKEMMRYIRENTEADAVFSGWNWSMPWYVDLDDAGDHIIKDRSTYPPHQRESVPEYFIVSPEWPLLKVTDKWPSVVNESSSSIKLNEARKKFLEENCTLVKVFGSDKHKWLLYKVNNDKLVQSNNQK